MPTSLLNKGVILDAASLGPDDIDLTPLTASVRVCDVHAVTRDDQIIERIRDADVVMTNKVKLGSVIFEKTPNLKLIVVLATGTNNIDLQAAKKHGITVCNITRYGAATVAQHTLTLMLALSTRLLAYVDDVKAGKWEQSPFFCLLYHPIVELSGKTLGIVGYGELGQSVARLAQALGMRILIAGRIDAEHIPIPEGRVSLNDMLSQADVVSLHCPLTPHTQHLMNAHRLSLMKPGAFLINTARGALVDHDALLAALTAGQLGGAAIDVLDVEPPPASHPLLQAVKNGVPNLILTPHCAWASREARQRLVDQAAHVLSAYQMGQAINVV
jgi:glycerate dehydrogenase